jgi:hypothetical protein
MELRRFCKTATSCKGVQRVMVISILLKKMFGEGDALAFDPMGKS